MSKVTLESSDRFDFTGLQCKRKYCARIKRSKSHVAVSPLHKFLVLICDRRKPNAVQEFDLGSLNQICLYHYLYLVYWYVILSVSSSWDWRTIGACLIRWITQKSTRPSGVKYFSFRIEFDLVHIEDRTSTVPSLPVCTGNGFLWRRSTCLFF